ncbi:hypothetical protein ASG90_13105 [Nocardioides sp. Soil797]|nr:hypothetical protein ASG90_13105 [Nocardioides sp. Soil797]
MDSRQASLLSTVDPTVLGERLRAARRSRGLTQSELAGDTASTGYISRIESGQRRPNAKTLVELAGRLHVGIEELLGGLAPSEYDELRLALDFAELSLETGDAAEALGQAADVLDRARTAQIDEFVARAAYVHARACEALGELDDAVLELERLLAGDDLSLVHIRAGIALTRCYRDSGDLSMAIEKGQGLLDQLEGTGLEQVDEAVQLAATLASAYFERGDVSHAIRICRTAATRAEEVGSSTARASAYWNASIMEAHRGHTRSAIPLAEQALSLLGEGTDARNLALLRTQVGTMQLATDPPQIDEAMRQLNRAAEDLRWSSAAPMDIAKNDLALARALHAAGDAFGAIELSRRVHEVAVEASPLVAANAKAIEGISLSTAGDLSGARTAYGAAVNLLTGVGADRSAAQLWFELANLLEEAGDVESALAAYRSAAASTGLRSTTSSRIHT